MVEEALVTDDVVLELGGLGVVLMSFHCEGEFYLFNYYRQTELALVANIYNI
jgi:hypothetical protein